MAKPIKLYDGEIWATPSVNLYFKAENGRIFKCTLGDEVKDME